MAEKSANYGPDLMRMAEKSLLLQLLDQIWKDHLLSLDHLRQGINLRAYAQRDPLNEYKREAFELFEAMLTNLRQHVTSVLSHVELRVQQQPAYAMAGGEPEMAMAEERATGTTGRSAGQSVPCGTFSSSTMIVMRIAITPSLNASSRALLTPDSLRSTSRWRSRKNLIRHVKKPKRI